MTAAYGLPDHLIDPVAQGVAIAASIAEVEDGEYEGVLIKTLAEKWQELCRVQGRHKDLLKPHEAAELRAVIELASEYAEDNSYGAEEDAGDFPEDVEFALCSEEILYTLADIARLSLLASA